MTDGKPCAMVGQINSVAAHSMSWITRHSWSIQKHRLAIRIGVANGFFRKVPFASISLDAGIGDLGPDGYDRFLRGELPPTLALRTAPVFRTAAPQYQWLHRLLCVSVGEVDFKSLEVRYDVFACG